MTNSEKVTKTRQKRKHEIVDIMGGHCALCGYNKNEAALELHHINKAEKDFSFSSYGSFPRYDVLIPELKKCILLCANCHREVHNPIEEEIKLYSSFNEDKALYYQQTSSSVKKEYYCIDCGKQLMDSRASRCAECEKKRRRVCERPDRESLKKLIRTKPFTQIGKEYGVSDNAIRKWCEVYNLPKNKKDINSYSESEWNDI